MKFGRARLGFAPGCEAGLRPAASLRRCIWGSAPGLGSAPLKSFLH